MRFPCNTVPVCNTEVANCNTHARRKMVDIVTRFPEPCAWVIGIYRVVYENDQHCKEQGLSAEARLVWHQTHSAGPMAELRRWCDAQFAQRRVEPNSALGKAIKYLTKHWGKLTLFLRKAGVPLDTNIVEQTLKTAILVRKNSLFFKTQKGAACADLYMSLIKTCRFHGVDAFHYLTSLLTYASAIQQAPEPWLPWNSPERWRRSPPIPPSRAVLAAAATPGRHDRLRDRRPSAASATHARAAPWRPRRPPASAEIVRSKGACGPPKTRYRHNIKS